MDRMEEYRVQGYTVFEGLYDETTMQTWRDEQDRLQALATEGPHVQERTHWFGNMLERAPQLMWPAVAHPVILDFAEQVVGPFVQLDNLTLAAFPSMDPEEAAGKVSAWHRDRWGRMPNGAYERPLAFNAICYLQDLDDEYGTAQGAARFSRRTHCPSRGGDPQAAPRRAIDLQKAGDVVLTHNGLLHSGTPNTSGRKRYFFSVYYNISWLKHTDTFTGPNCQQLIDWARSQQDHRALRLLGQDEHLQSRANSGFQQPDEARWHQWSQADQRALEEAARRE